jgi:hypothetical protein
MANRCCACAGRLSVWTADFSRALSDYDAGRPGEYHTDLQWPLRSHLGVVSCAWLKRSAPQSALTCCLLGAHHAAWQCMPAG